MDTTRTYEGMGQGQEAKTHGGVERLLQRGLRCDRPRDGKLLARLQAYRYEADYSVTFVFSDESAREEIEVAERFVAAADRLLRDGGWRASK